MSQALEQRKHSRKLTMFLRLLSETGSVPESSKLAGYSDVSFVYYQRRTNKEFAADWEEAMTRFGHVLEAEAIRRATKGVRKDVYYKGCVVGEEVIYSDGLMAKLLDGAMPEKYKPRENNQTNVNVKVGVAVVPMTATNVEDWERDAAITAAHDAIEDGAISRQNQEALPAPPNAIGLKVVRV